MTPEEAIKILSSETRREELESRFYWGGLNGDRAAASAFDEACRMAVDALQAQQTPATLDRSGWKKCEYCPVAPCFWGHRFCPSCGRPLTEDAWAELERRIGGNDGTADI